MPSKNKVFYAGSCSWNEMCWWTVTEGEDEVMTGWQRRTYVGTTHLDLLKAIQVIFGKDFALWHDLSARPLEFPLHLRPVRVSRVAMLVWAEKLHKSKWSFFFLRVIKAWEITRSNIYIYIYICTYIYNIYNIINCKHPAMGERCKKKNNWTECEWWFDGCNQCGSSTSSWREAKW